MTALRVLLVLLLLLVVGPVLPASAAATPSVTIAQGAVSGVAVDGSRSYRGIPYAVAERWKAPRAAPGWSGVRDGSAFGPECVNFIKGLLAQGGPTSEDCLFVNVARPDTDTGRALPVLFFLHGGGFHGGSGHSLDPAKLAASSGAVVVTVNYRLGPFGFFALPGTRADDPRVNFGLLDQQAGLRWVRDNIAAFGGDPAKVGLFGQSAGAISTCLHLVSPQSAGLFAGAIAQSGSCDFLVSPTPARMASASLDLARHLGCTDGPTQVACMRAKPVADIRTPTSWDVNIIRTEQMPAWLPAVDGATIPDLPATLIDRGRINRVPFMSGSTHDEGRLMVAGLYHWRHFRWVTKDDLAKLLTIESGGDAGKLARLTAAYTPAAYGTRDKAYAAVITDGYTACPVHGERRRLASQGIPTWGFEFNGTVPFGDVIDGWWGMPLGSFHGTDLSYLFQRPLPPLPAFPLSARQQTLAETMGRYWAAFADHGAPTGPGLPAWPGRHIQNLEPGATGPMSDGEFTARHHCDIWN